MLRLCKNNKQSVIEQVRNGRLDAITLSSSNLVDDIILAMHTHGILSCLESGIKDRRSHNTTVPYSVIWAAAIAAKMKVQTSLTDIPYAITDHRVLSELGYSLYDTCGRIGDALMTEGSIRFLIGKYSPEDFIEGYNETVQNYIMPLLDMKPCIHILDCTDIEVNLDNLNYEGAGLGYSKRRVDDNKPPTRGYKLATLRGIVDDSGVIEEVRFGPINIHDLTLSREMLMTSPVLKPGDILINDRGFISRDLMNFLKSERGVDTYIPLKKDMESFNLAVQIAKENDNWQDNNVRNRYGGQKIALAADLGNYWRSDTVENDVPINGCVIWHTDKNAYAVIITTDLTQSAESIIKTYALRPEIEEDYRQIKDFWKIEDFKSTKLTLIAFHVVCVLFGYLFFQLYTMLPDGKQYAGKSLPVLLKKYSAKVQGYVVLYVGDELGVLTLFEMLELYANASVGVRDMLAREIKRLESV